MTFTLEMIVNGINERKDLLHITHQQIADASGVSRSTVDRILKHQDNYIPTIQNLLDIANTVGYTFGQEEKEPLETADPKLQQIIDVYEARCEALENSSRLKTVQYNLLLAEKDRTIESQDKSLAKKDRWINRLASALFLVFLGIITVLLLDIAIRGIGWLL